jgi:hypothetical protein
MSVEARKFPNENEAVVNNLMEALKEVVPYVDKTKDGQIIFCASGKADGTVDWSRMYKECSSIRVVKAVDTYFAHLGGKLPTQAQLGVIRRAIGGYDWINTQGDSRPTSKSLRGWFIKG